MSDRLCKTCAHYWQASEGPLHDKCTHESTQRRNMVRGGLWPVFCNIERMNGGKCEPMGKLWEAKP